MPLANSSFCTSEKFRQFVTCSIITYLRTCSKRLYIRAARRSQKKYGPICDDADCSYQTSEIASVSRFDSCVTLWPTPSNIYFKCRDFIAGEKISRIAKCQNGKAERGIDNKESNGSWI